MPLGTEGGLDLCSVVLDGDPAHPSLQGHSPQFSASVCCVQTAGWTKMPLDIEVGLGPCYNVLDGEGTQLHPKGAHTQYSAHVHCGQTA